MIGVIFQFGNELIEIRVDGDSCLFKTSQFGGAFSTIESLKLDKNGVIKEFPELIERQDWREEAIKRFKDKIKSFNTEKLRMGYIIKDLKKYGYVPLYWQEQGFRPVKL